MSGFSAGLFEFAFAAGGARGKVKMMMRNDRKEAQKRGEFEYPASFEPLAPFCG
jgi:hypothetical protein